MDDHEPRKPRPGMPAWGQSWAVESVRERSLSDRRALIILWVVAVVSAVIAIWGQSIILGAFSVLALAVASSWTYTRRRNRAETPRPGP